MDPVSRAIPEIIWNGKRVDLDLKDILSDLQEGDRIELGPGRYQGPFQVYQDGVEIIGQEGAIIVGQACATDLNASGQKIGTFATPTMTINADHCRLRGLTIVNEAPDLGKQGQAIALYLEGEKIQVSNCRLLSGQDTLCLGPLPYNNIDGSPMISPFRKRRVPRASIYFDQCHIEGNVDFIFGGGQASFVQCHLHARFHKGPSYITAASTPEGQKGFTFDRCVISGESPYYLGRPWRDFAWVCFENSCFDDQLLPQGWHDWNKQQARESVTFIERANDYRSPLIREDWIVLEEKDES